MNTGARDSCRAVIIDNQDSFTHNISQYLAVSGAQVEIIDNKADADRVDALRPSHLVLSAGGGQADDPRDCGNVYRILERFAGRVPILGVCLGHQILARHLGARIVSAGDGRHGRISTLVSTAPAALLDGLPNEPAVMRYHSSVVAHGSLRPPAVVTSVARDDGEIMSFESPHWGLFGVQFHPESVGTPHGMRIISNFLGVKPPSPTRALKENSPCLQSSCSMSPTKVVTPSSIP